MSGPPVQSHGFQTSVDMARRQTTTTFASTSMAQAAVGQKRPHQALSQRHTASHNPNVDAAAGAKRRPVDFVRASTAIHSHGARIAASPIRCTPQPPGHRSGCTSDSAKANTITSHPPLASNPLLSLQHPKYALPPALVANFQAVGIHRIYPWQASCLLGRGHLTAEKNLLYTAPTGGGKSLVADVLMLKRVIENPHRKAILVLPYVALVQEKLKWLRRIVQDVEKSVDDPGNSDDVNANAKQRWSQPSKEIRVTGFFGGSKSRATWADTDIAVCTIEKVGSMSISRFLYIPLIRWCRQIR